MLKKVTLFAAMIIMILTGSSAGYDYFDVTWGNDNTGLTARSLAMGGVGLNSEVNGTAVFLNPAQLSRMDGLTLGLDYRLTYAREDWSFPAHDNFDGYLVDNIYSQSAVVYPDFGFSIGYKSNKKRFSPGIGISYHPLKDYRYTYEEEVRESSGFAQPNERDSLISINSVRNEGRAYYLGFGAGWDFNPFHVGISYNYAPAAENSDREFEKQKIYPDTTVTNTIEEKIVSPKETGYFLIGLSFRPSDRFQTSFTLRPEYMVEYGYSEYDSPLSVSQSGIYEEVIPFKIGTALSYRPRSATMSYLEVEFHYIHWSHYRLYDEGTQTVYGADTTAAAIDTTYYDNLENIWEVRVGVEHRFFSGIPARFGFRISPLPDNRRVLTTVVSVGTGFALGDLQIDLAGALTNRSSRQSSWFDTGNRWDAEINKLKESHLQGTVSALYRFQL